MAEIYNFHSYRGDRSPQDEPPRSRNQQILADLQAQLTAADTPEARLLSELRGLEETLLGNHRRYARLWEAAERLGIRLALPTPGEIAADPRRFPSPEQSDDQDRGREDDRGMGR